MLRKPTHTAVVPRLPASGDALSVAMAWLCAHTGDSLLLVMLMHAAGCAGRH
jgi:hypothetical protein